MEILIKTPSDLDESERMMALVEGLEKAELCKASTGLLVATEDEHVAGLLMRWGTRLDAPVSVVPPANNRGRGGRRKKVDGGPMPAPVAASEPVPDPMPEPNPVIEPVERRKKAGRPTRGITPALADDLRKIVAEAGQKALKGEPQRTPDEPGERSVETTYTSPVTGEEISYLDMRSRLRERRVNARERFVSSRQGLMEVYDKGTKLILVQVAE